MTVDILCMLSNSELYPGYFEYFIISVYYEYISLNPGEFIFVLVIILLSYVQTASSSPSSISCDPIVVSVFKDFVVLLGSGSHCGLVGGDLSVSSVLKLSGIFITIRSIHIQLKSEFRSS